MNLTPMLADLTSLMAASSSSSAVVIVFVLFICCHHLGEPLHQGRPEPGAGRFRPQTQDHGAGRHAREVGFRIVKGGGTFVLPVLEKVDMLSLELLTIDVQTPEVYTSKGVPVKVDGVAQIKVKGDDISIAHGGRTIFEQGAWTKSKTSPRKRWKAICARFSAR